MPRARGPSIQAMTGRNFLRVTICAATVLLLDSAQIFSAPAASKQNSVEVHHPNLLLSRKEIDQIKVKVQEQPWAARLLERVQEKARKDGAIIETALAYVLTGQTNYAVSVRKQLLRDAREQMAHYEKLDVTAEPEWARWTWWGAIAWAYDLAYDVFTPEERSEIERWLRTAGRTIIAQEKVLTTNGSPGPRVIP